MTSTFALNHRPSQLRRITHLETDNEGAPWQRQVPQTYEVIPIGGQVYVPNGSNNIVIPNDLSAGTLVLDFSVNENYYGRVVTITTLVETVSAIAINYGAGDIHTAGSSTVVNNLLIPAGLVPSTITANFLLLHDCFVSIADGSGGSVIADSQVVSNSLSVDPSQDLNSALPKAVVWNSTGLDNIVEGLTPSNGPTVNTATRYTATRAGNYTVSAEIWMDGFITGTNSILIRRNDLTSFVYSENVTGLTGSKLSGNVVIPMLVGDFIEIYTQHVSGNPAPVINASSLDGRLGITLN